MPTGNPRIVKRASARTWRWAQRAGVFATVALLAGLVAAPALTLTLLWSLIIPLVPLSLLVAPRLWRNVCPLATLNTMGNRWGLRRMPSGQTAALAMALGIGLLLLLVPGRRFVFNAQGVPLALTIAAVGVLALGLGMIYDVKAGFCNAICPVLPVERLYAQSPFAGLSNHRCSSCSKCSVQGCLDLAPRNAIAPFIGGRSSGRWLFTVYGAFAAAFPGFVFGYYQTVDGSWSHAGIVYLTIASWMALSYAVTLGLSGLLRLTWKASLPALAATAACIYYWYTAPVLSRTLGAPETAGVALRVVLLSIVICWYAFATVRSGFLSRERHT